MKAKIPCEQGTHRKQPSHILYRPAWDRCANELEASREVIAHISVTLDQAQDSLENASDDIKRIKKVLHECL